MMLSLLVSTYASTRRYAEQGPLYTVAVPAVVAPLVPLVPLPPPAPKGTELVAVALPPPPFAAVAVLTIPAIAVKVPG